MNKPIGPDLYRCSHCNDLTGMREGPCGRCEMSLPAPQPTTITKCALCGIAFTARPDGFVDEALEREASDHHAVCPKRPIEVGDYVRILSTTTGGPAGTCGELVEVNSADHHMPYRVKIPGDNYAWWCHMVERIPRPAAAQATAPVCCGKPMRRTGMGETPTLPAFLCNGCERYEQGGVRTDGAYWRSHPAGGSAWSVASDRARYASSQRPKVGDIIPLESGALGVRTLSGDIKITTDPTLKPGEVRVVQATPTGRPGVYTAPMPAPGESVTLSFPTCAPALLDGLTREQCLERWLENRLAVEGGAALPHKMNRMQRDVGRAMWLAGPGGEAERRAPRSGRRRPRDGAEQGDLF